MSLHCTHLSKPAWGSYPQTASFGDLGRRHLTSQKVLFSFTFIEPTFKTPLTEKHRWKRIPGFLFLLILLLLWVLVWISLYLGAKKARQFSE